MISLRLLVALLTGIIVAATSAIALIDLTGGSTGNATAVGQVIAVVTPAVTVLIALIYIEANAMHARIQQNEVLTHISRVAASTHTLVNSQRTIQLRLVARLARRIANDNPSDIEAQLSAEAADVELRRAEHTDAVEADRLADDLRTDSNRVKKLNGIEED